jgi:hypothetical protein
VISRQPLCWGFSKYKTAPAFDEVVSLYPKASSEAACGGKFDGLIR